MHTWKKGSEKSQTSLSVSLFLSLSQKHTLQDIPVLPPQTQLSFVSFSDSEFTGTGIFFFFIKFGFISNFTVYNMKGILENDISLCPRFCDALSDLISVLFVKFSLFYSLFNHIFIFIIYLIFLIVFFLILKILIVLLLLLLLLYIYMCLKI